MRNWNLLLMAAVAEPALTAQPKSAAANSNREMYNYVLTMETARKLAATQKTLEKTDPEVPRPGSTIKTVDSIVQRVQAERASRCR